ncbi:unnamed protein product [Nesidiocoris tenuis]|uniref:Uncharacterized protein n=1 Tax=Nesidiocoris tenuis TaxID=355587 RepID=A0A6H5H0K1_9HEMI|nr:unnamed protein product [Nesidiocoris tenuis]CAB0007063.1 unnamed protein product [Nesidiocoris tenuis]
MRPNGQWLVNNLIAEGSTLNTLWTILASEMRGSDWSRSSPRAAGHARDNFGFCQRANAWSSGVIGNGRVFLAASPSISCRTPHTTIATRTCPRVTRSRNSHLMRLSSTICNSFY